jgi:hypothetical protein
LTSQGKEIKNFQLGDDSDKFAPYKCAKGKADGMDDSTFNKTFYIDDIENTIPILRDIFSKSHTLTYDQIHEQAKINQDILSFTLDHMIRNKIKVSDTSYLIYRSNNYMLQPIDNKDTRLLVRDRAQYQKTKQFNVSLIKETVASNDTTLDIVHQIEKQCVELKKIHSNISEQILYDFIIDRLCKNEFIYLATTIEDRNNAIRQSLIRGHILIDNAEGWIRDISHPNLEEPIFYKNDGKTSVSTRELEKEIIPKVTFPKLRTLTGFISAKYISDDKVAVAFKVIDQDTPNSKGSTCVDKSTVHVSTLKETIQKIIPTLEVGKGKTVLCEQYELALRMFRGAEFGRTYATRFSLKNFKA